MCSYATSVVVYTVFIVSLSAYPTENNTGRAQGPRAKPWRITGVCRSSGFLGEEKPTENWIRIRSVCVQNNIRHRQSFSPRARLRKEKISNVTSNVPISLRFKGQAALALTRRGLSRTLRALRCNPAKRDFNIWLSLTIQYRAIATVKMFVFIILIEYYSVNEKKMSGVKLPVSRINKKLILFFWGNVLKN